MAVVTSPSLTHEQTPERPYSAQEVFTRQQGFNIYEMGLWTNPVFSYQTKDGETHTITCQSEAEDQPPRLSAEMLSQICESGYGVLYAQHLIRSFIEGAGVTSSRTHTFSTELIAQVYDEPDGRFINSDRIRSEVQAHLQTLIRANYPDPEGLLRVMNWRASQLGIPFASTDLAHTLENLSEVVSRLLIGHKFEWEDNYIRPHMIYLRRAITAYEETGRRNSDELFRLLGLRDSLAYQAYLIGIPYKDLNLPDLTTKERPLAPETPSVPKPRKPRLWEEPEDTPENIERKERRLQAVR